MPVAEGVMTSRTSERDEELPDFDDGEEELKGTDDDPVQEKETIAIPLPKADASVDLVGSTSREFSFGPDVTISAFAGSLGFDKVTDWQYYSTDPNTGERNEVSPPPMDPDRPGRTRSSSGGVVRLFLGEVTGKLGSKMRSRGIDARVIIKVREWLLRKCANLDERGV